MYKNNIKLNEKKDNVNCAVRKDQIINKKTAIVKIYKGKKYYFGCGACFWDFYNNPENYTN